MDFATLHKQRKFILIAAVIAAIGILMPWVSLFGFSINGAHNWGILVLILLVAAAVICFVGDKTLPMDQAMWLVSLVAGAAGVLRAVIFMSDMTSSSGFGVGVGVGAWVTLLASGGVIASALLLKSPGDNIKDGFDSLINKVSSAANTNNSSTNAGTSPSKIDELERLIKLREEGKITEEEYQELKSKIL
jgi:hypothetical protein